MTETPNNSNNGDQSYLIVKEASELLRISDSLTRRLFREGRLPGVQLGKRIVFDKETLRLWMREKAEANLKKAQAQADAQHQSPAPGKEER